MEHVTVVVPHQYSRHLPPLSQIQPNMMQGMSEKSPDHCKAQADKDH